MEILIIASIVCSFSCVVTICFFYLAHKKWKSIVLERSSLNELKRDLEEKRRGVEADLENAQKKISGEIKGIELKKSELEKEIFSVAAQRRDIEADERRLADHSLNLQSELLRTKTIQKNLEEEKSGIEKTRTELQRDRELIAYDRSLLQGERQAIASERTKLEELSRTLHQIGQQVNQEQRELEEIRRALGEMSVVAAKADLPTAQDSEEAHSTNLEIVTDHTPSIVYTEVNQSLQQSEIQKSAEQGIIQVPPNISESVPAQPPNLKTRKLDGNGGSIEKERPLSVLIKETKGVDPIKRGGGRTSTTDSIPPEIPVVKPSKLKPEIVCQKRERSWVLSVAASPEMDEDGVVSISQGGVNLIRNDHWIDRWDLNSLSSDVVVQTASETETISFADKTYLLFKLSSQNGDEGRLTKSLSSGHYLVVAPQEWERDLEICGPAPFSPEAVSPFEDYRAHFFFIEKDSSHSIAFTVSGQQLPVLDAAGRLGFELVGNRFPGNSGSECPLFMESPPRIKGPSQRAWAQVSEIIVGVEGPGRKKWRKQILPSADLVVQELPETILEHQSGWYFARIYNREGDLIDSLEFKFLGDLKGIILPEECQCPLNHGHQTVTVEIIHEASLTIEPANETSCDVSIQHTSSGTTLSIPPEPRLDKTKWSLAHQNEPVIEVSILVERLWWAITDRDGQPQEWNDKVFAIETGSFSPASSKALWIRFPSVSWCEGVCAGFSRQRGKNYPWKGQFTRIPLREFCDCDDLNNAPGLKKLRVWIKRGYKELELTPCSTMVRFHCRYHSCDFVADDQGEMMHHVISAHDKEIFYPMDYNDLRRLHHNLPKEIYKCPYCKNPSFYAESGDLRSPTSTILSHIDSVHRRCKASFSIITNAEEIRENILKDLPRHFKCIKCGKNFDGEPTESEKIEHLITRHHNELYYVR